LAEPEVLVGRMEPRILTFEHQPRFYHWILADIKTRGEFDGKTILGIKLHHEEAFVGEREQWVRRIIAENKELTKPRVYHLHAQNRSLNLAIQPSENFSKKCCYLLLSLKYK
jgi:hypothetical protein